MVEIVFIRSDSLNSKPIIYKHHIHSNPQKHSIYDIHQKYQCTVRIESIYCIFKLSFLTVRDVFFRQHTHVLPIHIYNIQNESHRGTQYPLQDHLGFIFSIQVGSPTHYSALMP